MATSLPALRGRIGETEYFSTLLTFGEVARLVEFVEDIDDWDDETEPEGKAQRKLNVARVEREMVPYLLNSPDHFYAALTVEVRPPLGDDGAEAIPFEPVGQPFPGGVAFALVAFARRRGAKMVHSACLLLAAIGLVIFPHLDNKYLVFIPIIGFGIAWASIMGVPYIMAVRMIPSTRYGVYMGIINMMIVIPMLIQSLTFGTIYSSVLGDNPNNAIMFAGVFLAIAALVMQWIKEPPIVRDVDDIGAMPMAGGH